MVSRLTDRHDMTEIMLKVATHTLSRATHPFLQNCLNLNLTKQGHLKNCLNQTTAMRMFLKLKQKLYRSLMHVQVFILYEYFCSCKKCCVLTD
ncbi:hypothetical protein DPMN_116373 [Dreissena polymorpha]|uniref:Uncharacterized protein n=1 Tax=Dreissena polymorpha TaxID=45954 RepID=A0A9D4IXD3_DREPO|nr:hypothetical protein DPMN_168584 [Dreissena polymorpha]KAH3842869.1 hypothetical protein DPMN_116373 [Dreissena polymorpha]